LKPYSTFQILEPLPNGRIVTRLVRDSSKDCGPMRPHDEVVRHICAELTPTETVFPGTELRLIYENYGSSLIHRDPDV
jgi:hypothetical protein